MLSARPKPVEMLEEAYAYGCRYFGENKVQELDEKYDIMPKDIHWQMIGHLQRNKVKYIIDKAELIHSVDSIRLAETIDKEAAQKRYCCKCASRSKHGEKEDTKFGLMPEEVMDLFMKLSDFNT